MDDDVNNYIYVSTNKNFLTQYVINLVIQFSPLGFEQNIQHHTCTTWATWLCIQQPIQKAIQEMDELNMW